MDYYDLLKHRTNKKRIIAAVIAVIIGLVMIISGINEVKVYMDGPIDIRDIEDIDDRYLSNYVGQYITIKVDNIDMFLGAEERRGTKYGFIPCKKSGWIVGYEGCMQYTNLIVTGKESKRMVELFDKLLEYDNGETEEYPKVEEQITGKIVKRTGVWQKFMEEFYNSLIDEGKSTSLNDINEDLGEYMVDASYPMPLPQMICQVIGILLMIWAAWLISGIFFKGDKKKIDKYIASYNKKYNKTMLYKDCKKASRYGAVAIGEKFIFYIKRMNNKVLVRNGLKVVKVKKGIFISKIRVMDANDIVYVIKCRKKYANAIKMGINDEI